MEQDNPTTAAFERVVNTVNRKTGGADLPSGVFVHVVATYDGAQMRVYVNGRETGAGATDNTAMPATTVNAFIGSAGIGTNYFKGDIDEVAVYDKALSAVQIAAHYAAAAK